ncbi:MAG: hypothetical protein PVG20_05250 [Thioalkalispiraceae bacterium]|jgi:hypothetical protein
MSFIYWLASIALRVKSVNLYSQNNCWKKHDPDYSREVIRYLIRHQQTEILGNYLGLNNRYGLPAEMVLQSSPSAQLVFSEARRLGYQLKIKDDGLALQEN